MADSLILASFIWPIIGGINGVWIPKTLPTVVVAVWGVEIALVSVDVEVSAKTDKGNKVKNKTIDISFDFISRDALIKL